ncbi:uncharacterized protein LOC144912879 [Branchiostoma floridae x Branchiostoma belcheri]
MQLPRSNISPGAARGVTVIGSDFDEEPGKQQPDTNPEGRVGGRVPYCHDKGDGHTRMYGIPCCTGPPSTPASSVSLLPDTGGTCPICPPIWQLPTRPSLLPAKPSFQRTDGRQETVGRVCIKTWRTFYSSVEIVLLPW